MQEIYKNSLGQTLYYSYWWIFLL